MRSIGIGRLPQTRRIDQHEGKAADIEMDLDRIARRAGNGRDDRRLALGERIEQRRFAGIGRPGDHDGHTFADDLAGSPLRKRRYEICPHRSQQARERPARERRHIRLVGEIDLGLQKRRRFEKRRPPGFRLLPQGAARLAESLTALHFGLGLDQIGKTLDFGQVELAVFEGATRKFAGFRRARLRGNSPTLPAERR